MTLPDFSHTTEDHHAARWIAPPYYDLCHPCLYGPVHGVGKETPRDSLRGASDRPRLGGCRTNWAWREACSTRQLRRDAHLCHDLCTRRVLDRYKSQVMGFANVR